MLLPVMFGLAALAIAGGTACGAQEESGGLTEREKRLLERIARLEERVAALEGRRPAAATPAPREEAVRETAGGGSGETRIGTVSTYFDGYYGWNTNRPAGRENQLRAYDVTSNGFSLNQAGVVLEKAPEAAAGRRWGYRLDLMFGQATEALQGNPLNEPRPDVYRNVFQAYGTYVAPLGRGLTVDFGKWASPLGYEGNYTKDQINYSRSYLFGLLPFYHMGVRTSYSVNDRLSVGYWLVNGANQSEDFNGAKSQLAQVVVMPAKQVSWTVQYYSGRERVGAGDGQTGILDTYLAWTRGRLTLAGELDAMQTRAAGGAGSKRVTGGAAYARYQLTRRMYAGQRYVRLNDTHGLFSGKAQSLNDLTSTLGYRFGEGFEARLEYRRDFSDVPFFLTSQPGRLNRTQSTVTVGLLWWYGGKQGGW
jgi:hypothetical protein